MTTIVRIRTARVRDKALIDRPEIELSDMLKRVVAKPMFLQMRIMITLARIE